jgi:hypothetical protein
MADEDVVVGEVGADPIETPENPIVDFLKSVEDQDFVSAEQQFNSMVGDRLQNTLDQAKMRIAQTIYGEEEVDAVQDELSDEEVDEVEELEDPTDEEDAAEEDVAGV